MLYIKYTDLDKRMSQVHTSILLKRSRQSAAARSCACFILCHIKNNFKKKESSRIYFNIDLEAVIV